jgi:hypothetical protein
MVCEHHSVVSFPNNKLWAAKERKKKMQTNILFKLRVSLRVI